MSGSRQWQAGASACASNICASSVRIFGLQLLGAGALLLSTALPAAAQVETVIVTAQKTAQDIQNVPIAVSAFDSDQLAAHQIEGFGDLQFAVPSVTFSHGNFGPSNFQIRGIGSAAVTTSGDSGVSVNVNDIYLSSPPLTAATYYDLERIEVLRGPQSTLYGRNATGGAINQITKKPDLEAIGAEGEVTYGNYNSFQMRAALNIPIIQDELAVRAAGFFERRDGTIDNIFPSMNPGTTVADKIDSRHDFSVRGSVRWEPSAKTTIDFMAQASHGEDSRVRSQVQMCHRDPSGVLGCLPDSLAFQPVNGNSTLGNIITSNLTLGDVLSLNDVVGPNAFPGGGAAAIVPADYRKVNTDFTPISAGNDTFLYGQWRQTLNSWLNMNVLLGYDQNTGLAQQSYNNAPDAPFAASDATCTQKTLLGVPCAVPFERLTAAQYIFSGIAPKNFAQYYAGHIGTLPTSGVGNNGIIGGNIQEYSDRTHGYDQISGHDMEWTAEWRFTTNFDGPLNFLVAYYHLHDQNDAEYFVNANTLDYAGTVLGALTAGDGFILGPTQYDSNSQRYRLSSNAAFGEVYYEAIPDTLKFTGGIRYTVDNKSFTSRQTLFNVPMAIGTTGEEADAILSVVPGSHSQATTFHALTGRFVVDWTPKLDFTDQTLVYASYARGYRSGGFNPPSFTGAFADTFQPETLDSFEVGTKNTLLDGHVIANMTAWHYTYNGFQISKIVDRTSINENINAKLWGVEGEFFYAPDSNWQFNVNFGYTHSALENTSSIDPRDPTAGQANVTLVKDGNGANCVISNTPGMPSAEAAGLVIPPPVPTPGVFASGYGAGAFCSQSQAAFNASLPAPLQGHYTISSGIPVSLDGNKMPTTPDWTISLGVQYTFAFESGYSLVPRVDFYWKDSMFGRIFNGPADRIASSENTNLQIQLNAPDDRWYARAWVQNVFDEDNVTGMYVTDASSGLFTNVFVNDPRLFGITLGARF